MNSQLTAIIKDTQQKLAVLEQPQNIEYEQLLVTTQKLQKQLLSVSLLDKPNLEAQIKEQLKIVELKMLASKNSNRDLELGFLKQYIRETYE